MTLAPLFVKYFLFNFTQVLIMTISEKKLHFSFVCPRPRSLLHLAGAFITFSDFLVFFFFLVKGDLVLKCKSDGGKNIHIS